MKRWCMAGALMASTAGAQELRMAKVEAAHAARPPLFARDVFMRRQDIVDVQLSPDGRFLSFLRRGSGGFDVLVQDITSGTQTRVMGGVSRADVSWSGDGARLWVADAQGLAVLEGDVHAARRVLKWDPRHSQRFRGVDPRAPHVAIIEENGRTAGTRYRYLTVNAHGKTQLLLEARQPVRNVLLDAQGQLAFVAAFEGLRYETVVRDYSDPRHREILRCSIVEDCELVGFNAEAGTAWLLAHEDGNLRVLRRWRRASNRWETVHRDPAGVTDADGVLWSPVRHDWIALSYHEGRRRWYGNGAQDQTLMTALQQLVPDANLQYSAANDGLTVLVHAQQADLADDRYYLYRVRQQQLFPLFARERSAERTPRGAPMVSVRYRARDGMQLHGYVMLPSGVAASTAPLIAWVHGGPITRTYDRYNAALQLLVNRGYAVFIPNFRASTGFGLQYMQAARGDVGNGRVLGDIVDGMDYLLDQGIGDPRRQGVMGLSFGGYMGLLAISHYPSRFRVAFAGAPPTDYGWIKQWQAEHDSDALRAGGPPLSVIFPALEFRFNDVAWRDTMHRASPLAMIPALQTPAYIWAGAHDDHVPLTSIVHYVTAVRRAGKAVQVIIDPDGGHVPQSDLGNEAMLYQMELAAHRHLGGGIVAPSAALAAFLRRNVRMNLEAPDAMRGAGSRPP